MAVNIINATIEQAYIGSPPVVINGLVYYTDAANQLSYTSGSTTLFDLSGNNYNGTLTNGPTFDSGNGGSIVFDGVNDFITGSSAGTFNLSTNQNYTIGTWISPSFANTNTTGSAIFNFSGTGSLFLRTYLRWEGSANGFYLDTANSGGGSAWRTTANTFAANSWNYLCFTHTSANVGQYYFNGRAVATTTLASVARTGVTGFPITLGFGSVNSYYWRGKIGIVQLYNRTLSAQEIAQNYNATKIRYF